MRTAAVMEPGKLPYLAAFVGDDKPSDAFARAASWMTDEARFEFGLQAILDAVGGPRRLTREGAEARGRKRR